MKTSNVDSEDMEKKKRKRGAHGKEREKGDQRD